jgi:hypothetical protein
MRQFPPLSVSSHVPKAKEAKTGDNCVVLRSSVESRRQWTTSLPFAPVGDDGEKWGNSGSTTKMQQSCGGNHRCSANSGASRGVIELSGQVRQSWLCPKHPTDRTASHRVSDGRIPSHQIILFSLTLSRRLGLYGLVPFSCFLFFCLILRVCGPNGGECRWQACGFLTFTSLSWVFLALPILLNCCPS